MRPMVAVRTKQNEIVVIETPRLHPLKQRDGWFVWNPFDGLNVVDCLGRCDVTTWHTRLDTLPSAPLAQSLTLRNLPRPQLVPLLRVEERHIHQVLRIAIYFLLTIHL